MEKMRRTSLCESSVVRTPAWHTEDPRTNPWPLPPKVLSWKVIGKTLIQFSRSCITCSGIDAETIPSNCSTSSQVEAGNVSSLRSCRATAQSRPAC